MNRNGLFGGVPIGSYFNEPQVQKFDMGGHAHPHGGNPYAQYADSMQDAGLTNLSGTTRTNQTSRLANNEFYRDRYNDSLNPVDPISHDDNSNYRAHTNEEVNSGSIFGNLDWDQVRKDEREAIRKEEVLQEWVQRNAKPNIQSPYFRNAELAAANKKSSELFGDLEYDANIINTAHTDPYRRYDWDKTAPTGVRISSTDGSSPDNIFAKIGPRADRTKVFTGFSHEEKSPIAMYLPRDINLGGLYRDLKYRGYDDFDLMLRGLGNIETNQILLDARLSKPPVAAHESIHGAFDKIEEMYEEDKDHFSKEYGESAAFMMKNLYSDGLLLAERMTEYFDNLDDSRFDMDYTQDTFISPELKGIMRKVVSGEDFFWDEVPSKSEEDSFSLESYSGEKVVETKDWTPIQEVEGMVGLVKAAEDIYKERYLSKNPDSNPLRPKVRPQSPSPLRPKARPDKIQFGLGEVQKFDMGGHAHPHGGVADRREARKALGNANLAAGKYDNIQALQDWVASNEDKPKVNNDALATILSGGASNVSPVSVPIYNPVMDDPYIVGDGEGFTPNYIKDQRPIIGQSYGNIISQGIGDAGEAIYADPIGFGKGIAYAAYQGGKDFLADKSGTIYNYGKGVIDSAKNIGTKSLSDYLPAGVDELTATPEQMTTARKAKLSDYLNASALVPAAGVATATAKAGGKLVGQGIEAGLKFGNSDTPVDHLPSWWDEEVDKYTASYKPYVTGNEFDYDPLLIDAIKAHTEDDIFESLSEKINSVRPGLLRNLNMLKGAYPETTTNAEANAKLLLELRDAGRQHEITTELFKASDWKYLTENIDLDLSTGGRDLRFAARGFGPNDIFHGSKMRNNQANTPEERHDIPERFDENWNAHPKTRVNPGDVRNFDFKNPNEELRGERVSGPITEFNPNLSTFGSDNRQVARTYAPGRGNDYDGLYTLRASEDNILNVEGNNRNWGAMKVSEMPDDVREFLRTKGLRGQIMNDDDYISTDKLAWVADRLGYKGVNINDLIDMMDTVPNQKTYINPDGGETDGLTSTITIRTKDGYKSKDALMDPKLEHIKDLLSSNKYGTGGLGSIATA